MPSDASFHMKQIFPSMQAEDMVSKIDAWKSFKKFFLDS